MPNECIEYFGSYNAVYLETLAEELEEHLELSADGMHQEPEAVTPQKPLEPSTEGKQQEPAAMTRSWASIVKSCKPAVVQKAN